MTQGRANSTNTEPYSIPNTKAVNPGGAGNIGQHFGNHTEDGDFTPQITPLYSGRGYTAPPIRNTSHKSGSQGKY